MPTLADIRTKVRRITRSPSNAQLSDVDIDTYVNTFVLYDMPQTLQLFDLKKTLTFYTRAYIGEYSTNTTDPLEPLYDFKNQYISLWNPLYIAGFPGVIAQSRELFYTMYPQQCYINAEPYLGDGGRRTFFGTLSYRPVMENYVTFSSRGIDGNGNIIQLVLHDIPHIDPVTGNTMTTGDLVIPNTPAPVIPDPDNIINYVTGQYRLTFPTAPAVGQPINSEVIPYVAARPYTLLYYNDAFTFRPIPDQAYAVQIDVQVRPTGFIAAGDTPDINQWWQYIAYGAAKKVFEDRLDQDSIQLIMPELLNQETLVQRKTILQQSTQRTATIYNQPMNYRYGYGWGSDWGAFMILFTVLTSCFALL